jgi:hypothetical protein
MAQLSHSWLVRRAMLDTAIAVVDALVKKEYSHDALPLPLLFTAFLNV